MTASEAITREKIFATVILVGISLVAGFLCFWVYLTYAFPKAPATPCRECIDGVNNAWSCGSESQHDKALCRQAREAELGECMKLCKKEVCE